MALPVINSFTGQEFRERSVADRIWQCDTDRDLILLNKIGGTNGGRGKFGVREINDNYVKWYSTGGRPTSTRINDGSGISAPVTTGDDAFGNPVYNAETWDIDDAGIFAQNMVLEIPQSNINNTSEFVFVNSVNRDANTINVTRGWRGTPVYAYSDNQEIGILTIVAEECDTGQALKPLGFTNDQNYFQTFIASMEDTMRRQKMSKSFLDYDPYEEEMRRLMGGSARGRRYTGTLPLLLERTAFYGIPSPGGSNGDSSMGGIASFPILNYVTSKFSPKFLNNVAKTLFMNGAQVDGQDLLVSPSVYEMISYWGLGTMTTVRTENTVGQVINKVQTPWGILNVQSHRHLRPYEAWILDTDKIGMVELWGWTETSIPQTNALCFKSDIHGCFSLLLACPEHHARIRIDSSCVDDFEFDPGVVAPADVIADISEPGVVVA